MNLMQYLIISLGLPSLTIIYSDALATIVLPASAFGRLLEASALIIAYLSINSGLMSPKGTALIGGAHPGSSLFCDALNSSAEISPSNHLWVFVLYPCLWKPLSL